MFKKKIQEREEEGNLRVLTTPIAIDFASNDYLGFARCPDIKEAIINAWKHSELPYCGSTGSRLLTGNHSCFEKCESKIAAFHRAESALIFNSGYCANVGLLSCIAEIKDVFLYDAHVHASSIDGMRLSRARTKLSWRHNDVEHLKKRLETVDRRGNIFVVVESVYSCDGSLAPLEEICEVCEKYGALLIIDEAHATGVFGRHGAGFAEIFADNPLVIARVHTFSKSLGVFGGVVLGSKDLKQYLINFSRAFIYATALPVPVVLAVNHVYERMVNAGEARRRLMGLVDYFKSLMQMQGFTLLPSVTQIQSLIVPGSARARSLSHVFASYGIDVRALCAPTVKAGSERLRFCLHSFNTEEQIDRMIHLLNDVYEQEEVS